MQIQWPKVVDLQYLCSICQNMRVLGGNAFYDRSKDLVPSCQKAIDAAEFWADQIKIPLFQIDKRGIFQGFAISLLR